MNSSRLNDWIQVIGMSAIIASLIFVGLQVKQAQDIAIASQYQARSDALRDQFAAFLESDAAMRVILYAMLLGYLVLYVWLMRIQMRLHRIQRNRAEAALS